MNLRRLTVATAFAVLLLAAPAAASTSAAAGPSPTPLILEVLLAVIVLTIMAIREPLGRAYASVRRALSPRRAASQPRARRA